MSMLHPELDNYSLSWHISFSISHPSCVMLQIYAGQINNQHQIIVATKFCCRKHEIFSWWFRVSLQVRVSPRKLAQPEMVDRDTPCLVINWITHSLMLWQFLFEMFEKKKNTVVPWRTMIGFITRESSLCVGYLWRICNCLSCRENFSLWTFF